MVATRHYWALLDPDALIRIRSVLHSAAIVHELRSPRELFDLLRKQPDACAMVDQDLLAAAGANWGTTRPVSAHCAHHARPELTTLERLILRSVQPPYLWDLLTELEDCLGQLPQAVQHGIRAAVLLPEAPPTGAALARSAGIGRRALYRRARRIGLPSLRLLLSAGRFLRAYSMLADTGCSVRRASQLAGYPSARAFGSHALALTGLPPTRLRRMQHPAVIQLIVARIARQ